MKKLIEQMKKLFMPTPVVKPVEVKISRYNSSITSAASSGNIAAFDKYFNLSIPSEVNYYEPTSTAVWNGQLEIYKHILTKPEFLEHEYVKTTFQGRFTSACLRNHVHIVKYMLSESYPFKVNIAHDNHQALINAARTKAMDVIHFLIVEKNLEITPEIKVLLNHKHLEYPNPGDVSQEALDGIEKYLEIAKMHSSLDAALTKKDSISLRRKI